MILIKNGYIIQDNSLIKKDILVSDKIIKIDDIPTIKKAYKLLLANLSAIKIINEINTILPDTIPTIVGDNLSFFIIIPPLYSLLLFYHNLRFLAIKKAYL